MAIVSMLVSPVASMATSAPAQVVPSGAAIPTQTKSDVLKIGAGAAAFWSGLSLVGAAAGAYHGTLRNDSVWWGLAWGIAGGAFPIIVPSIALAQGFGKRNRT